MWHFYLAFPLFLSPHNKNHVISLKCMWDQPVSKIRQNRDKRLASVLQLFPRQVRTGTHNTSEQSRLGFLWDPGAGPLNGNTARCYFKTAMPRDCAMLARVSGKGKREHHRTFLLVLCCLFLGPAFAWFM